MSSPASSDIWTQESCANRDTLGKGIKHPLRLCLAHHFLAVGVERIIDNPLGGVDRVVVLEPQMVRRLSFWL